MTGWGKRKDGQAYPKNGSKKGIKSSSTKAVADVFLKEKKNDEPKFEKITKEILIGKDNNGEAVMLEIHGDRDYFSITGDEVGVGDAITEEEGEQRAKEYVESDSEYLWKQAVESGQTTDSLDDWEKQWLENESWQDILGDYHDIGNGKWARTDSGGQIDVHQKFSDWEHLEIPEAELKVILKAWKELHLVHYDKMSKTQLELASKAFEIFNKHKTFEYTDLGKYAD